ncbi:hypothetical protein [Flavobacterium sharifuzzamanii]|uniref:hypothetical protein n=1 Tax=Flavobacterium sharifuzzamanii TaxID=2211133 RepID=UPI000DAB4930|nr:hypothetical protein [Flavobacterium sharifuzzamanii]KAF2081840.1 hypothetical protein DMA14_05070 [Flavobacterium sharifuzzamanii]
MRKKIKNVLKVILIFSIAMTLTNCENESTEVSNQDPSVVNAKNWFQQTNPELSILKYTKKVDWEQAIVTDGEKGKVVEVPLILEDKIAVKNNDESLKTYNRLVFVVDKNDMYKLSHVVISTNESDFATNDKSFNFYNVKSNFEGFITVLDSQNKISYFSIRGNKTISSSISSKIKLEDETCLYLVKTYDDGSYEIIYLISCGGGGSGDGSGGGGYGGGADGSGAVTSDGQLLQTINASDPSAFSMTFFELTQEQKNQVLAKANFYLLPWAGITVNIVQNKNIGKPFSIDSVTTDSWGLTLGYTWHQTTYRQNTVGNKTTITLEGKITYGTGIEGIGDVYGQLVTYEIVVNNTNGHIESGIRN